VAVGLGNGFSCSHTSNTYSYSQCWGSNALGQTGLGVYVRFELPMLEVPGIDNASAIGGGDGFGCALDGATVLCWGDNGLGQLGNGTFNRSLDPVDVPL
jgi:alpha-tubulin suppressor-like RCC1 family protein